MYKHILIATDGSDLASKALGQGLSLAKALAAQVTIVTVTEPWATRVMGEAAIAFPFNEYERAMAANAADILSKASAMATQVGVVCSTVHVTERHPADGILETANGRACDLIVMASHGRRGLAQLLLGNQARNVVAHSSIPVLICR
jgi:nucleotide-binding universal stress UspA family protein